MRGIKKLIGVRTIGIKKEFGVAQNLQNVLLRMGTKYKRAHKKSGDV